MAANPGSRAPGRRSRRRLGDQPCARLARRQAVAEHSHRLRQDIGITDIGITPQRRASRAPSWLAWCQPEGVHPITGVTRLQVARYATQLDTAEVAGPARAHITASHCVFLQDGAVYTYRFDGSLSLPAGYRCSLMLAKQPASRHERDKVLLIL